MNICFYSADTKWGGLANNGGSRTILLSAETLRELGHQVDVVASSDKFTWFKHPKVISKIPEYTDWVVAISISDIKSMINYMPKNARAAYWMRGFETWQMSEEKILKNLRLGQLNIVNDSWLRGFLRLKYIPSTLCYPGLEDWITIGATVPQKDEKLVIGFRGKTMHKTKRYDLCEKMMKVLGDEYSYKILSGVSREDLFSFYTSCDIWFAPTEMDCFHNPPAMANLCGALVVCNRYLTNGTHDYADEQTAMRYNTFDEAMECIKNPDWSKVEKMQKVLKEKIGTRESCMRKFVKILEDA